ncbi:MAG: DUF5615 family PIN-like protein [Candidatus Levybacteria bacterium]|nr:DUF5615 family PIN-like protein [Candidatus Levybacteria bacterium]
MKLLADENFPPSLISALQKKRHDVKRIQRVARGISDISVHGRAKRESRVIITFDRDFLIKAPVEERASVMLFRFLDRMPEEIVSYLGGAIEAMRKRRKKKKPFALICSEKGIEEVKILMK